MELSDDIAAAFHQTSGALDPALVRCLDFLNNLPVFRAYKAHSWDSLRIQDGARILDVACGVGFDVIGMARRFPNAQFIGVDVSAAFLDIARKRAADLRNVAFEQADAAALPFVDGSFDGVRIDRSLQHIEAPLRAIREMFRVTRPGGRVVATEPDWGTYVVYNGAAETSLAIAEKWKRSFINPHIGRELGQLLADAGVEEIATNAVTLMLTNLDDADAVYDLRRVVQNCVASGDLTKAEGSAWLDQALATTQRGSFFTCLTIVECSGTRPLAPTA